MPAGGATARQTRAQQRAAARAPAVKPIPFTAAAHEHTEPVTTVGPLALTAATQNAGPFDVPAYGYLRNVFIEVTLSGGVLGAGALSADHPWNIFQSLSLLDVNGAPIFGPMDGYAAYVANQLGGYAYRQDPKLGPWYSNAINGKFFLRIPIEISRHSGLGSLANQNAAASYKLQWSLNPTTVVYSVAPTTPANVTIKAWLEAWSLPNPADVHGRPQEQAPPLHGTTQYWSFFNKTGLASGAQTWQLPRVGNMIRALAFITRDNAGARVDTVMPDPTIFSWDARQLRNESQNLHTQRLMEAIQAPATRDTGVFGFLFNNLVLGHAGDEEANLWIPTVQSSRLEVNGNNSAAGQVQVLTNDVAPAEILPYERFVEGAATGFHPAVGQPVPYAA